MIIKTAIASPIMPQTNPAIAIPRPPTAGSSAAFFFPIMLRIIAKIAIIIPMKTVKPKGMEMIPIIMPAMARPFDLWTGGGGGGGGGGVVGPVGGGG